MKSLITAAAVAIGITLAGAQPATASASTDSATDQYATFEGEVIDMSVDRSEAVACAITDTGNRCYRSESDMDRNERTAPAARAGSCSSSVRLYSGTGHSGSVTSIYARGTWINLSTYGADNTTSSYKVGACSAAFRSGNFGTGSNYPGSTSAYAQSTSMVSGWNNVVSSVRLS